MTLVEVAEVLNVTERQVNALVRSGDLRGIKIGGRGIWRVEAVELEKYIQRQYDHTYAEGADPTDAEDPVDR